MYKPLRLSSTVSHGRPVCNIKFRDKHFGHSPAKCTDESVNAFVSLTPTRASLETPPCPSTEFRADDDVNQASKDKCLGSLSGLSVAVKDNICTSKLPTTCSSAMLKGFNPKYNATVVDLLQDAGAHIVGKTNCDEFGMGTLNVHTCHGPVVNPFQHASDPSPWPSRERRSAGGSSGGSAAAVASMQCFAALSTDTGGSTRLPASYCGVVGLKPSYGMLSRWGVISFADSLDTVGIIASRVRDVRRIFDAVSVFDHKDPTSIPEDLRAQAQVACRKQVDFSIPHGTKDLKGLRIGVPQEYFPAELEPSVLESFRGALRNLKTLGASLIPVSLPSTPYALSAYYVLASAEASSNMARYDGVRYGTFVPPPEGTDKTRTANVYAHSRSHGFGPEVQKRILLGTYALTVGAFDNYFLQAQRLRNLVRADFDRVFRIPNVLSRRCLSDDNGPPAGGGVDVLVHPSAIRTAPRLAEAMSQGLETYVQDTLTVPASLAGLPAISVPAGHGEDGWPVGVSVVSQWGCEEMVLRVGDVIDGVY